MNKEIKTGPITAKALKKSIASHIARYSMIKSLNASLFSFGTVTLLLFSEAFRSLSAGERRAHSCQLKILKNIQLIIFLMNNEFYVYRKRESIFGNTK
ncbi:hypothetical protein FJQ98_08795 [Lysinibacillus agricola]|uniref:Uncharacterized protein n=1 Tax=Lysinibacillus agricola TaxID=2590012 RepID=A0ABX7AVT4_9BACI|nr:hypothetical protein [Lysinibacillus agricola]QQP14097.1 hypothetical protein FJQ98_08795 [Lysinibacillus agricola]